MPAAPIEDDVPLLRRTAATLATRSHGDLAALAAACCSSVVAVADEWVTTSSAAKGWTQVRDSAAEEWAGGPMPVVRLLRLVEQHHRARADAQPHAPRRTHTNADGTVTHHVVPTPGFADALLLRGHRASLHIAAGEHPPPPPPHGDLAVVLGAGNITATPLLDTIDQVLLRGRAVLLKLSPLHATLQSVFARALAPMVAADLLRLDCGGADLGERLASHPDVAAVHVTGSTATAAALRQHPQIASKELTAELGCCTPAFVVPGAWRESELRHVAAQAAAFTAWNGGATCVAPRVLLTAMAWPQRNTFLQHVHAALAALPARVPFHAATRQHFVAATGSEPTDARLPPTLRSGLDADRDAGLLAREHFAPVLLEVPLPAATTATWLDAATTFVRERVFGALSAYVWAPPRVLAAHGGALHTALRRLPHGTVAINSWTGLGYGLGCTPWGVPATAPWQCGIGWAHDLWAEPALQRVVLEAPFRSWPPPPWLPGRRGGAAALRALTFYYASPSLRRLAAVLFHACR